MFSESLAAARRQTRTDTGWILHTGGRDVILALRDKLQLSGSDVRHSSAVLREFGNISSPTVYFVLERAPERFRARRPVVDVRIRRGLRLSRRIFGSECCVKRIVQPELLDTLPPDDPRAVRSRRDLRRVNGWMRNHAIMADALKNALNGRAPGQITELGAGDGNFLLRVAQKIRVGQASSLPNADPVRRNVMYIA